MDSSVWKQRCLLVAEFCFPKNCNYCVIAAFTSVKCCLCQTSQYIIYIITYQSLSPSLRKKKTSLYLIPLIWFYVEFFMLPKWVDRCASFASNFFFFFCCSLFASQPKHCINALWFSGPNKQWMNKLEILYQKFYVKDIIF